MERINNLIIRQAILLTCVVYILTGCAVAPKDALSCHYEPIRGTAVSISDSQPVLLRFTPDSAGDEIWFKRFKVDKNKLEVLLHHLHFKVHSGKQYDAIVNIRTSGHCTPYVVYLLH